VELTHLEPIVETKRNANGTYSQLIGVRVFFEGYEKPGLVLTQTHVSAHKSNLEDDVDMLYTLWKKVQDSEA